MGSGFEDQWRERFEEFADERDDDAGIAGWTVSGLEARVRRFLALWSRERRGRQAWLDAGCGAGTYTRILGGEGHRVVGVDYSVPALRKAVARSSHAAGFVAADVRRLPFGGEEFDGVLCFGVTQALAESDAMVRELGRLVRPGGELWVDALNGSCAIHAAGRMWRLALRRPPHLRYESPRRLREICRRNGFAEVTLHWMPIVPRNAPRAQRLIESPAVAWLLRNVPLAGMLVSHAFIVHARKAVEASREEAGALNRQV